MSEQPEAHAVVARDLGRIATAGRDITMAEEGERAVPVGWDLNAIGSAAKLALDFRRPARNRATRTAGAEQHSSQNAKRGAEESCRRDAAGERMHGAGKY